MLKPVLRARVEEWDEFSAKRIGRGNTDSLAPIAFATGEPKVFLGGWPAECFWYEVFDLESGAEIAFIGLTIAATVPRLFGNTLA